MILFWTMLIVALFVGPYVFDMIVHWSLRLMARYLPSDIAGPDGWLVDTRARTGVFDR